MGQVSTDQGGVDTDIPFQIELFAFSIIHLLGIISVMSQVAWPVLIIFIPVVATCIWYQVSVLQVFNSTSSTEVNNVRKTCIVSTRCCIHSLLKMKIMKQTVSFLKDPA